MNLYLIERTNINDADPGETIALIIAAPDPQRAYTEANDHVKDEPHALTHTTTKNTRLGTGPGPVRVILDSRRT